MRWKDDWERQENLARVGQLRQKPPGREADNVLALTRKETPPMDETATKVGEQKPANLEALHQELRSMKSRAKRAASAGKNRPRDVQGPAVVIRGN